MDRAFVIKENYKFKIDLFDFLLHVYQINSREIEGSRLDTRVYEWVYWFQTNMD